MRILQTVDYNELSKIAANVIIDGVIKQPNIVLGLATGETPSKTYRLLIDNHKRNGTSFRGVQTINLDEYIGIPYEHPESYHSYMKKNLFDYINIKKENTHIPLGCASNLEEECLRYDEVLASLKHVDIQLLGIGNNGHIGFNEPGTSFSLQTHVTKLDDRTRKANSRFFHNKNEVPTHAITMGIASILKSKRIILLASGKSKAQAIKQLLLGDVNEKFPASALKLHNNVTIIADSMALNALNESELKQFVNEREFH